MSDVRGAATSMLEHEHPNTGPHSQARAEWLVEQIPALVNGDDDLLRRARWFDCQWIVKVGAQEFHLSQRAGRMSAIRRGPLFMAQWSFALEASADAWHAFWQPVPEPGHHDILALSKTGLLKINGDITPLMRNLQVVKDVVATPRKLIATHRASAQGQTNG
ncbi:MAG: hypothetical protein AAF709_22590 [Pseudomonadota bacterium]